MRMMTSSRLQNWTSQILNGLSYLHAQHIVHTNLTGNNVLLNCADVDKCVLKIADLASITQLKGATAMPNEVFFGGTLSYMSPEMFMQYFLSETERQFVVGTKTDIWSFGCLCLEMMSGTAPQYEALVRNDELDIADSSGMPKIRAMRAIIGGAVPSFLRKCSLSIVEFVLDCLELNPDMRWVAKALLESRFYKVDANALKWDSNEESTNIPFEREEYLTGGNSGVQIHVGRLVVEDNEQKEIIIKTTPLPPQGEARERYIFASKRRALKILRLDHPHIVSYIDFRYSNSRVHPQCEVLMEYCTGGTLAAASRQQRPCPELFRKWCQQILLGIEYLHHWRIIHRDIKGENIFLSSPHRSTCVLKIGDLDDITVLSRERSEGQNVSFRGTDPFLSAEMYALHGLMNEYEKHRVGRKTDIWSYGCVVLQMWMGKSPAYTNERISDAGTLVAGTSQRIRPQLPDDLPVDIAVLVNSCVEVDPQRRLDATELLKCSFFANN
ncbi:hypothetical protein RvY_19050 [Ramazzottius varieornatus]|uniref:Protein kinase domain-containing protein n=1 Tax=Ramazzottius varieornatus TaxID=947166 RepID=A0A1D1WAG8_RAMVA|nr:hypothetical protein RvY_19050 [Ramazzottius varieornatus]